MIWLYFALRSYKWALSVAGVPKWQSRTDLISKLLLYSGALIALVLLILLVLLIDASAAEAQAIAEHDAGGVAFYGTLTTWFWSLFILVMIL